MKELFARASRNILFKALAEIVSRLIYLVFFVYLARKLGDNSFGLFSFAFSFAGIFGMILDPGLNVIITRDVAADKNRGPHYVGLVVGMKLVLAIVSLALTLAFIKILGYEHQTVLVVVAMSVFWIFNAFIEFQVALFNAYERMEFDAILKITNKVVMTVLGIVSLQLGFRTLGVTTVIAVAMGLSVLLGFYLINSRFFQIKIGFHWGDARKLLMPAFPIAVMILLNALYMKIDVVLMSELKLPQAEIGWYAASSRLIEVLNVIPALVVGGLFPIMSTLWVENREQLVTIVHKAFQFLVIFAVPIIVILGLRSIDVISFLYGSGYVRSAEALGILSITSLFMFPNFVFSHLFIVVNKQRVNAYFSACAVVVNVAMNLLFIPVLGFIGVSWVAVITSFVLFLLNVMAMVKFMRASPVTEFLLKPIGSGLLMAGVLELLTDQPIAVALALSTCSYIIGLVVLKTFSKKDLMMVHGYVSGILKTEK
jgi:O-antigen/teichoic acid export membrane protein